MLLEALKAFIIGLVEGVTEWLPISSTGHMILVDEFVHLDVSTAFLELFLVVIQIGAILAVIILYFTKLNPFSRKKTKEQRNETWRLWGMVCVGCIPAAIVGLLFDDWVTEHLHNAWVVAAMLILYGIVFIVLEAHNKRKYVQFIHDHDLLDKKTNPDIMFPIKTVDEIHWKAALKIGLFQCLAIIPGTSRSGATIIGGMLTGCSRTAAAEFTFFLAIPIMFGWGIVKAIKTFFGLGLVMTATEVVVLLVGIVTAFVVSILSIKFLMGYIKKNDFTAFGVYRIVIGALVLVFFGVKLILG